MKRTRVRPAARLLLAGAVAVVAAGGVSRGLEARAGVGVGGLMPAASRTYVVRPGDTLWSIAERLRPGSDPRPIVDAIERVNGVSAGELVPGQSLRIPAQVSAGA